MKRNLLQTIFAIFEMQRTEHEIINCCTMIALQIMLESFRVAPQEGQSWLNHYTFGEEKNLPSAPLSEHVRKWCAPVDDFESVTDKANKVGIRMWIMLWLDSFLEALLHLGVVLRRQLRWHFVCYDSYISSSSPSCTSCWHCARCLSQFQICVCAMLLDLCAWCQSASSSSVCVSPRHRRPTQDRAASV